MCLLSQSSRRLSVRLTGVISGEALLDCLGRGTYGPIEEDTGYSAMEMALLILDGLDSGAAHSALLKLAMKESAKFTTEELCSSKVVGFILKWVVRSDSDPTVDRVADKFKQLDASLLSAALLRSLWNVLVLLK